MDYSDTWSGMRTLLLVSAFFVSIQTMAASKWPRPVVALRYNTFTGENGHSFNDKTSVGGGLNLVFDNYSTRFQPFIGAYYGVIDSKQDFYDDNTLVNSSFFLQSLNLEPGINVYIMGRAPGYNIYLTAAGIVGSQSLTLSKTITFQRLPRSDTGYSYGGRLGLGAEWMRGQTFSTKSRWALSTELSYRKESTVLINQDFTMDGLTMALGLSW